VVANAEVGLAYGLIETVTAVATIGGSLAAGLLYARSANLPFIVSLVMIIATLPLVWRFAPRRDAHSPEPEPTPEMASRGPAPLL
jgi:hypothetical protein